MSNTIQVGLRIPAQRAYLRVALDALVTLNVLMLRRNPGLPSIYSAGVVYQREPPRQLENWKTIADLLVSKSGDCEDLASARAAELRVQGIAARPWLIRINQRLWHVVVRLPDGTIEDPSKRLGMKGSG